MIHVSENISLIAHDFLHALLIASQLIYLFFLLFQAYIFDIRSGTYIHKLTGQTDVIADVAFHPLNPQVQ